MRIEASRLQLLLEPFSAGPYRVVAFCDLILDDGFVVTGVRALEGPAGVFASMPDHKHRVPCPNCGHKVDADDRFCRHCARAFVGADALPRFETDRLFHDVCHPINATTRDQTNQAVRQAVADARARRGLSVSMVA